MASASNAITKNAVAVDPNDVSKCALDHYDHVLSKGKPRSGDEWTIYAAIVAASISRMEVVSCATGTKCTTVGPEGWTLRDTHAEVLCRRGLLRVLLQEISEKKLQLLEKCDDSCTYRLRHDTTLHLYVSASPCGDASIYPIIHEKEDLNFTGAKVIVQKDEKSSHDGQLLPVNSCDDTCVAREDTQQLGGLRTKSGRSNLPQHLRSTCMSCSDKLLRWSLFGLQGSWLPFEIRLSSIVISRDVNAVSLQAQRRALERAICHRKQQVVEELQSRDGECEVAKRLSEHDVAIHVVEHQFPDGKASSCHAISDIIAASTDTDDKKESKPTDDDSRKRKRDASTAASTTSKKRRKEKSPCGVSINWQWGGETEVVVGARGIRQGKKPKSDDDYVNMTSRLSRGALVQLANKSKQTDFKSYREFKTRQAHPSYADSRTLVFSTRPFQGWLVGSNDFELLYHNGT